MLEQSRSMPVSLPDRGRLSSSDRLLGDLERRRSPGASPEEPLSNDIQGVIACA